MMKLKNLKWGILLGIVFTLCINLWIEHISKTSIFNEITEIPKNKVGIILGTSKQISHGQINLYYKYRLEAAVKLFNSKKIDFILISGDNSSKDYDEPTTFKEDLIAQGIPESKIFLDYAGFRTLDSVLRAKAVFGLNTFTIISQKFHNERAVYLAHSHGINAIAFNAKDVKNSYGLKTLLREYLARVNAFMDVLFNTNPKFLGPAIDIK